MRIFNKKGQNTAEYAILIALIIAAAVAMQTYVKRGVQGGVKDGSDKIVSDLQSADWSKISNVTVTAEQQFEPSEFSAQTTKETLQEDVTYTMEKKGTTAKDITKRTQQAAGDYQTYDKVK